MTSGNAYLPGIGAKPSNDEHHGRSNVGSKPAQPGTNVLPGHPLPTAPTARASHCPSGRLVGQSANLSGCALTPVRLSAELLGQSANHPGQRDHPQRPPRASPDSGRDGDLALRRWHHQAPAEVLLARHHFDQRRPAVPRTSGRRPGSAADRARCKHPTARLPSARAVDCPSGRLPERSTARAVDCSGSPPTCPLTAPAVR